LTKVMKERNLEEGCIEQIVRLFKTRLLEEEPIVDEHGFIRMDDYEMSEEVQAVVDDRWNRLTAENLAQYADVDGYHKDFLKLFGFGLDGVDYAADVLVDVPIPSCERI